MTKVNRAYSLLEIKEFNEGEERVFKGIATTPNPDRVNDIVDPLGVKFKNPLPLLFHHDSRLPIGLVTFEKPTKNGIKFEARLPKILEEGALKSRIDEAWQTIKAGLIRAVSIGFRVLDYEYIEASGGNKFTETEILELSAVVIPANADAVITSVKSFDLGLDETKTLDMVEKTNSEASKVLTVKAEASKPGVTGIKSINSGRSAVTNLENKNMKKTYNEQIADFEATLKVKNARLGAIMDEAAEKGETLNGEQEEEFETLTAEVKAIETHITRLSNLAAAVAKDAKPVGEVTTQKTGSDARNPSVAAVPVTRVKNEEKGLEFARFAMTLGAAKDNLMFAQEIAKNRYGDNDAVTIAVKAAVAAGTTTNPTWAAPLVDTYQRFAGDFVEFLRPQTILGKFGQNGVPSLRRVPFNISIPTQTSGGDGYWVGQAQAKPLTKFDFSEINLGFAKVANIAVITEELLRFSNPSAEAIVRDQLAAALIARLDTDFVDPAKTAVTNVSPASITNGIAGIPSSGTDIDAVRADIKAVFASYLAANVNPTTGVWIMPSLIALSLALMTNPLGQPEFPGLTLTGGTLNGMPVIVSDYVPAGTVILVNASDVFLADDGQVNVDASNQASLQMANGEDLTNASGSLGTTNPGVAVPTTLVSLWQTNSVGIRAERYINWAKRRASAVAYLTGVNWGDGPTT